MKIISGLSITTIHSFKQSKCWRERRKGRVCLVIDVLFYVNDSSVICWCDWYDPIEFKQTDVLSTMLNYYPR